MRNNLGRVIIFLSVAWALWLLLFPQWERPYRRAGEFRGMDQLERRWVFDSPSDEAHVKYGQTVIQVVGALFLGFTAWLPIGGYVLWLRRGRKAAQGPRGALNKKRRWMALLLVSGVWFVVTLCGSAAQRHLAERGIPSVGGRMQAAVNEFAPVEKQLEESSVGRGIAMAGRVVGCLFLGVLTLWIFDLARWVWRWMNGGGEAGAIPKEDGLIEGESLFDEAVRKQKERGAGKD